MNEELQSTNEELETTNEEVRTRASEVLSLNERLESLLSSLQSAVIMLDRELLVELWNSKAEELWGLRSEEVEREPFATLEFGLPVAAVLPVIRRCLDSSAVLDTVELEGVTRTGKPTRFRLACSSIDGPEPASGVVLVVDTIDD
jgi:two-component system, chemotaxis family, CheB/CheR fusion protein